jgi:hypothetical protein
MAKVIVERPRGGWLRKSRQKGYRRYLQRTAEAGLPTRECMLGLWNGGTKHFSEHLGPLRKYLRSQVGRPWNKVHAEMCRHIRADSVVQNHILTHVWGYVALHVVIMNGVPCFAEPPWIGRPLSPGDLYVCPQSRLLKITKPRRRQQIRRLMVSEDLQYHLVDGIWHEVRLRKLPADFDGCWDALLNRRIGTTRRGELTNAYGQAAYAVSARPLTKLEARKLVHSRR